MNRCQKELNEIILKLSPVNMYRVLVVARTLLKMQDESKAS